MSTPIKFRVSSRIDYTVRSPVTVLFNVRPQASPAQKILSEKFSTGPAFDDEIILSPTESNRFDRLQIRDTDKLTLNYEAEVEVKLQFLNPEHLRAVPPAQMDSNHLPYLLPSRYCQSDHLARFAWQKFGRYTNVYDQVTAIVDWIHDNVEYVRGASSAVTSAYDTVIQCAGVCRDFAHLGIALCRALTLPSRYLSCYAYKLDPPDFHACFEVFIGGYWVLFDATRLAAPNGLVLIGSGRDAADVSVCTAFGVVTFVDQNITCEMLDRMQPLATSDLAATAVSFDAERT